MDVSSALHRIPVLHLLLIISLHAADWLMLQGTYTPKKEAPLQPKPSGFIQVNYLNDEGTLFVGANGRLKTPFSLLVPELSTQSGFNIFRARLALLGAADDANSINYFIMTEFGNNGITNPAAHHISSAHLTDASITFKQIPHLFVRVGRFKTPGSEEGLRAVYVSPYIQFTAMTAQQMLERPIYNVGNAQFGAAAGGASTLHLTSTDVTQPVSAFRDTGIQLFERFKVHEHVTLSAAYRLGNGNGISNSRTSTQPTHYYYVALEHPFGGGRGFYTRALKLFMWAEQGKRTLLSAHPATPSKSVETERNRYGLGVSYYNHGVRAEVEYLYAAGMIFTGAKDTNRDPAAEN